MKKFSLAIFFSLLLVLNLVTATLPTANAAESIFFPQTGFSLSDEHGFLSYWRDNGGLAQFGYPTTAEILEMNPEDKTVYTVQWFERNRFEYHPENKGTQYEVLLGLLGNQQTLKRRASGESVFRRLNNPNYPNSTYFNDTGHTLRNSFKEYWEKNGGLAIYGFPISEEFTEISPTDGKSYTVQWFERNRFEYHPENKGTQYEVLLGLLGNELTGGAFYPDATAASVTSQIEVPAAWRKGAFTTNRFLRLPPGFKMSVFVSDLKDPRLMAFAPNGDLFVSERNNNGAGVGKIKIIRDPNKDGVADSVLTYAENISPYPHGLAFYGGYLYVAFETKVVRYPYQTGDVNPRAAAQTIIGDLPSGRTGVANGHNTRTITFGADGKLYLSIGSSCDNCLETQKYRAAVWQFNADGSGGKEYAGGLRNAVGISFDPATNILWAVVNGRNSLGNDFPPEQIAALRPGGFYGWPYCVGTNPPRPDPQFGAGKEQFCANVTDRALQTLPAHTAPLGLTFYTGKQFPDPYRGGMFITSHGSAASETGTVYGAGIKYLSTRPGKFVKGPLEIASGWSNPDGVSYWGRPVASVVGSDGVLYVTDDVAGAIYRLTYK